MAKAKKHFIVYKPKGVLCQFTSEHGKKCLADIIAVPKDIYPVGRLDEDSEGLLILSNDKSLTEKLLNPINAHWRTYLVQVAGNISNKAIKQLEQGVTISLKTGDHNTLPAKCKKLGKPKNILDLPVSEKVTSWIKLSLQEGKNRQVRKMTAQVGFPTLRLVRTHIEDLELGSLSPGENFQVPSDMLEKRLRL